MTRYDWQRKAVPLFSDVVLADIDRAEAELKTKLHSDLVAFYRKHNGAAFPGTPEFEYHSPTDTADITRRETGSLCMVFGIRFDDGYIDMDTLVDAQNAYAINECVPRKYLAIGRPFHHAIICMSQSGEDAGAVYIWEPPDISETPEVPSTEFLSRIAPTLFSFLDSLRDDS